VISDDLRVQHSLLLNLQTLQHRTAEQRDALQRDVQVVREDLKFADEALTAAVKDTQYFIAEASSLRSALNAEMIAKDALRIERDALAVELEELKNQKAGAEKRSPV
jgi:hypothetical protein